MILERLEKNGWMMFHNMLMFREQMKKVDKTQQASRDHRKQVETFTVKSRLYVDALSSSEKYSDDSETSEPSIPTSDTSLENKDIWFYKTDKEDHFNWEKMIILT